MLYPDHSGEIDKLLDQAAQASRLTTVTDDYGAVHRLYGIDDPAAIEQIQRLMADKKLLIADGHHRYETALAFKNDHPELAGAGKVMMTFVNMYSPGLRILATHRVLRDLAVDRDAFLAKVGQKFKVSKLESFAALQQLWEQTDLESVRIGVAFPDTQTASGCSSGRARRSLDVKVLHEELIEGALGYQRRSGARREAHPLCSRPRHSRPRGPRRRRRDRLPARADYHRPGRRYQLRRRRHAPEVHRLLSQAAERHDDLQTREVAMEALVLGCGEAFDNDLFNTSILLRTGAATILLDCGYSIPPRVWQAVADPNAIDLVYISHPHADHYFGLPALLGRMWEDGRTKKLTVLTQPQVIEQIRAAMELGYRGLANRFQYEIEWLPATLDAASSIARSAIFASPKRSTR